MFNRFFILGIFLICLLILHSTVAKKGLPATLIPIAQSEKFHADLPKHVAIIAVNQNYANSAADTQLVCQNGTRIELRRLARRRLGQFLRHSTSNSGAGMILSKKYLISQINS